MAPYQKSPWLFPAVASAPHRPGWEAVLTGPPSSQGASLQAPQLGLAASATSLLWGAFLGGRWVAGGWREQLYTPVLPGFGTSPTGGTLQLGNLGGSLNFQGLSFSVQELGGRAPALLGVESAQ